VDDVGYADTYDQLSATVALGYDFHWNPKLRARRLQEGIDYGRQAIRILPPDEHKQLIARIYVRVALFLDAQGDNGFQYDVQEKLDQEALEYWRMAEKLDKQAAMLQVAYPPPGFYRILNDTEGAQICNEALNLARKTGDNFAIGWILHQAAARMFFEVFRYLDDAERVRVAKNALELAEQAQYRHSLTNFVTPNDGVLWPVSPYVEHFKQLSWFTRDPATRRALLEKGRSESPNLLKFARLSGYPKINAYALAMAGTVLAELADWTADNAEKKRLLEASMKHRTKSRKIVMSTMPDAIETVANVLRGAADLKAAIADLEPNPRKKVRLLRSALSDKERGVSLYAKYLENVSRGQPHILHRIGGKNQTEYGDLLTKVYDVTKDEKLLPIIVKAYSDAATTLKKGGSAKGLGLAYWKAAEANDLQQANVAAAENFALAAKAYRSIENKSPQIVSIFQDYARYMEAWNNIEQAKTAHKRLAYENAEKFYETAADLHRMTERWDFFGPYYDAFSWLESAENLSKEGDCRAAAAKFEDAAERFKEAAANLKRDMMFLNEPQEKSAVDRLANSPSEEYCRGRQLIEEAREAEDQGDHQTSAEKFEAASEILGKTAQALTSRREKNEFLYILTLAKAWKEMAESYDPKNSTKGFRNAISLFEKSLNYSRDENTKNVSLGHKHFCEGVEASEEFNHTLNSADYDKAAKHLTAASAHFARAGFNIQSLHVQGCKLLLDAHEKITESSKDTDPVNGAESYNRTSELLREAAEAFAKSHQTAKWRQVMSLVEGINEQRGLSERLANISKTMSRISPTVAFPTPTGRQESPIGHAKLIGSHIDVDYGYSKSPGKEEIGDEVSVDVRIANIGTESIQILRIENLVPEGVKVTSVPENAKVAHGSLIPIRKNTAQMNVETFHFSLEVGNGPTVVRPKIIYTDMKGRELSHEPAPKVIISSPILEHLAREFIEDYTKRRLAHEHSGWRTLTSISKSLKVPRSHFYGERRWGHVYAKPLETLLKSDIVECRTFPGERGRGGHIMKARLAINSDIAKLYLEEKGQSLSRE